MQYGSDWIVAAASRRTAFNCERNISWLFSDLWEERHIELQSDEICANYVLGDIAEKLLTVTPESVRQKRAIFNKLPWN